MKPSQFISLATAAINNRFALMVTGPPGCGKTDATKQAAEQAGADLIISHPVVSDPTDYKGMPALVEGPSGQKEAMFLPFNDLKVLIEASKPTVFFLDDFGQAMAGVQAAAMQLILGGRINGHHVSDQVMFMAATNRKEDKAGVGPMLEPVKNRFTIVELDPDLDDYCAWAIANGVPTPVISFIRFCPHYLTDWKPAKGSALVNGPTARSITQAGRWLAAGIPAGLEFDVFKGAAGEAFAADFLAHLRIWQKLPNPDVVLSDPDGYKVPTDVATQYALAGALAARANEDNLGRFFRATNRMPPEFSVLATRDALRRDKTLANCREFIEWVSTNQDVVL